MKYINKRAQFLRLSEQAPKFSRERGHRVGIAIPLKRWLVYVQMRRLLRLDSHFLRLSRVTQALLTREIPLCCVDISRRDWNLQLDYIPRRGRQIVAQLFGKSNASQVHGPVDIGSTSCH